MSTTAARTSPLSCWNDLPLAQKGFVVLLVPALPLVMTTWIFMVSLGQEQKARTLVDDTLRIQVGLETVLGALNHAESDVRMFDATGSEPYRGSSLESVGKIPAVLDDLETLVVDPGQAGRLRELRQRIAVHLTQPAEGNQASSSPASRRSTMTPSDLSDIRTLVLTIRQVQERLLDERHFQAEVFSARTRSIAWAGVGIGGLGGLLAAVLYATGVSRRVKRLQHSATRLGRGEPPGPPDGQDEIGRVSQALAATSDLLARREQALREATEDVDRYFAVSLDFLAVATFEGRFIRVNSTWTKVLGWSAEELTSRPYADFVHPDDLARTDQETHHLNDGQVTETFVNRYRAKDGSYRWLEWKAVPVAERRLIYGSARDVTEQRLATERLEQAQRRADEANQSKSEFLSRMSHDLRTPLNAILGFAQLLSSEPLDPANQDSVKQILTGGKHLLTLINEVLDLARIESGHLSLSPEPLDVAEILEQAVEFVKPLAEQRSIRLRVGTLGPGVYVRADRQRLNQILLNLLSNAIKYNRTGGLVTVTVTAPSSARLRLSVADTGPGIRPEFLERLFQPFERLGAEETATDGTGLGLVVAKRLAEALHGTIGVTSQVDVGSTFWVELPRTEVPTVGLVDEAPPKAGASHMESHLDGDVLYIEDNASNRLLMERILARRPTIRLTTATTATAGLEQLRRRRPDLVFLDLHLPDLDGYEVVRQLWADPATRGIPVAILSADATPGQMRRLMAAGARAYLPKPLDVHGILQLVDEVVGREAGRASA